MFKIQFWPYFFVRFWWNLNLTLILMQLASHIKQWSASWVLQKISLKNYKKTKKSIFFCHGQLSSFARVFALRVSQNVWKKIHNKPPSCGWPIYKPVVHLNQPHCSNKTPMTHGAAKLSPIFLLFLQLFWHFQAI